MVVDARIIDMLEFAKQQCEASGGRVNVALGAVLSIWHDYREVGTDDETPNCSHGPSFEAARHTS